MIRKAWICLKLAGPVLAVMHLGGCCIIGAGFGAASDWSKPKDHVLLGCNVADLRPGVEVEVIRKTGHRDSGDYQSLEYSPGPDFCEEYSRAREQELASAPLPALGETVQVLTDGQGTWQGGEFAGFAGWHRVWLHVGSEEQPTRPQLLPMRLVRDSRGGVLRADVVERMLSRETLPLPSAIVLQTAQGDRAITVQRIEKVRRRVRKHGALRGFAAGALIDAAVALGIYSFWNHNMQFDFSTSGRR